LRAAPLATIANPEPSAGVRKKNFGDKKRKRKLVIRRAREGIGSGKRRGWSARKKKE